MELVEKIKCRVRVRATMDEEGKSSLTVIATAAYAEGSRREATATVEIEDGESELRRALVMVMDQHAQEAARKARSAAIKAREIAEHNGEAI